MAAVERGTQSLAIAVVRGAEAAGIAQLLDEVVQNSAGRTILRAAGSPDRTRAALSLIGELTDRPDGLDVADGGAGGSLDERDATVARAVDALLDRLAVSTADGPAVLVVDDLQWVDRASIDALRLAAGRASHDRLTILLTVRSVPDTRDDIAQLLDTAERLGAVVVDLQPIDAAGTTAADLLAAGPPFGSRQIDVLLAAAQESLHTAPARAAELFTVVVEHTREDDVRHRAARTGAAEARLWAAQGIDAGTTDRDPMTRVQEEYARGRMTQATLTEAERWARTTLSGAQLDESLARIARYAAAAFTPLPHLIDELDRRSGSLSPLAEVWLRHAQDRLLFLTGEFVESMWIGERAKAAGDRLPPEHPARVEASLTFGRLACQTDRRHLEGFEALRWAEQRAEELGLVTRQIDVCLDHGIQLKMWDRWDEADARFSAGVALAGEIGARTSQDNFERELAGLAIPRGDVARAEEIVAARAGRPDPVALWAVYIGHLRLVQGDVDAAMRILVPLAEGRDVFPEVRRLSLELLARAASEADDDRARDALRAGCLLLTGDTHPARVCRTMVLATADGASDVADTVLRDLTDAPPFIRGGYSLLAGIAHRRAGQDERAVECLTDAHDLATDRGASATVRTIRRMLEDLGVRMTAPVPDRPATGWASITTAEMRVVELVAEGLVYREIAERLFLSRRTVESHVASALRKLNLRNRSQLATAFLTDGTSHAR